MIRLRHAWSAFMILGAVTSCNKQTCPDYWQYPDCNIQSRTRFFGLYRGISNTENMPPAATQWNAGDAYGLQVSEICISSNLTLVLDPKDTRVFKVKEGSRIGNRYIRHEGYGGRFTDDSLYFDFWLYDDPGPVAGASRTHYTFAGRKK